MEHHWQITIGIVVCINKRESDTPWEQDSAYYNDGPTNDYYIDPGEKRWNQLLKMRNQGLLTEDELDIYIGNDTYGLTEHISEASGFTRFSCIIYKKSRLFRLDFSYL